ncbi:hypothetical protein BJ912DRAFT_1080626 [Pholiota molesta]|nr:hypothetical protein BJ912DRAFT_1080626 [Pholiota molesta]
MPLEDITTLVARLENEAEASKQDIRPKVLEPYQNAARWIPLAIGPFINIDAAIYAGAAKVNNLAPPPNTDDEDLENFQKFMEFCPDLKQVIRGFKNDADVLQRFIGHLSSAASNSRADDTSACRKATRDYVALTFKMNPRVTLEKKCDRGWNNVYTARLLCPLKYTEVFDENPKAFMASVLDGTTKIKASHWPSFLYPPNTPYNRESLDDGLFTGPVLVAFLRNICTGPTSASNGIRRASKPSKAEIHGMEHVTGRCIAYVALQAYFSLSAIEQWSSSAQEGFFDLEDFYIRCLKVFETDPEDEWVVDTLDYLTRELPSLKRTYKRKRRGNVRDVSSDDSDEDETKLIEAQRRARRQARNIENATSGNKRFDGANDDFETAEPGASGTNTPRPPASAHPSQVGGDGSGESENDMERPHRDKQSVHTNNKKGKGRAA